MCVLKTWQEVSVFTKLCSCSEFLYFEVETLLHVGVGYLFKGIFLKT